MKSNKNTLKRILNLLSPYKLRMVVSLLLAVVIVLTTLYLPILTGRAVDTIVSKGFHKAFKNSNIDGYNDGCYSRFTVVYDCYK